MLSWYYRRAPFFEGYKFRGFRGFWGLPRKLFHQKLVEFYHDTDCRLKRRHQCRFVKMVSSNFPFAKYAALEKRCPMVAICGCHMTILLHSYVNCDTLYGSQLIPLIDCHQSDFYLPCIIYLRITKVCSEDNGNSC